MRDLLVWPLVRLSVWALHRDLTWLHARAVFLAYHVRYRNRAEREAAWAAMLREAREIVSGARRARAAGEG